MADLSGFNANDVPDVPDADYSPAPEGWYECVIFATKVEASKKNNANKMLVVDFRIEAGEHRGKTFRNYLNLWHSNERTVAIAQRDLRDICLAINVPEPQDTIELHHIPLMCKLEINVYTTDKGEERANNTPVEFAAAERQPATPIQEDEIPF